MRQVCSTGKHSGVFGIMMPDAPASWCQTLRDRAVWKIEKFKYSKKTNDFQWDSQNDEVLQKKFFPKVLIFIGFFNFMGLKWFPPYIRANWGPLKCEFVKFEGLLTCYISKLIPVIGKFIATHLSIRLVCQGPPRPLERDLRAPGGGPWIVICQVWRLVGMLYIKIDPSDRESHCNTSFCKFGVSGAPQAP